MKPVSLADITYEQGLKLIAMRKQAIDSGKVRPMTKEALDNSYMLRDIGITVFEKAAEGGWLDSIKSTLGQWGSEAQQGLQGLGNQAKESWKGLTDSINPATRNVLTKGLLGAGIGGLGGLGASALDKDERKHWARNALMGGIAGGALGGGIGLYQNPEVAEAIQNKFKEMSKPTKPTKPAAPAADGSSPGGSASPTAPKKPAAPAGFDAQAEFERIQALPPAERLAEIERLRGVSESYAPELVYGTGAAGTTGGTAYGLRKLYNMRQYSPEALAGALLKQTDKFGDRAIQSMAAETGLVDKLKHLLPGGQARVDQLMGTAPATTAADVLNHLRQMPGGEGKRLLQEVLEQSDNYGRNFLGNVADESSLKHLLAGTGDDVTESILTRSLRGGRPGRLAGMLGLLGMGGTALHHLGKGYMDQRASRNNATAVLERMRQQMK